MWRLRRSGCVGVGQSLLQASSVPSAIFEYQVQEAQVRSLDIPVRPAISAVRGAQNTISAPQ